MGSQQVDSYSATIAGAGRLFWDQDRQWPNSPHTTKTTASVRLPTTSMVYDREESHVTMPAIHRHGIIRSGAGSLKALRSMDYGLIRLEVGHATGNRISRPGQG